MFPLDGDYDLMVWSFQPLRNDSRLVGRHLLKTKTQELVLHEPTTRTVSPGLSYLSFIGPQCAWSRKNNLLRNRRDVLDLLPYGCRGPDHTGVSLHESHLFSSVDDHKVEMCNGPADIRIDCRPCTVRSHCVCAREGRGRT
jgi:hypothetical protein